MDRGCLDHFMNTAVDEGAVGGAAVSTPTNISTGHSDYDCCEVFGLAHKSNDMDTCPRYQDSANLPEQLL